MKLAVFFPGIGYTTDKPLLYYSEKLAKQYQYETVRVAYGELSKDLDQAFTDALAGTERVLTKYDWTQYEEILFVSKSIGTAVSCAYAEKYNVKCRNIYYTPLEQTFSCNPQSGIVFHGTADPWAKTEAIKEKCREYDLPLHIIEGTNHSLEVADNTKRNLHNLTQIMELTEQYIADTV
ncbi:MAG: alpha/beta hydrolase [Lachnospiraceae bacterium]|nr:alpha/beta hydrolase [Lachnospiraceae bacterium]